MIAITESGDNLQHLSRLSFQRLRDRAIEEHCSEAAARQGKGMILYTIWRYEKWREGLDDAGVPYQSIGACFRDLSRDMGEAASGIFPMSPNSCYKLIQGIKDQLGNGIPVEDVVELPIRMIDELRTLASERDHDTGEVLALTPEADENLPLPGGTPSERMRALLQELPHLSVPDQYARIRDIKGQPTIVVAQVQHDEAEASISFIVVNRDTGEQYARVKASYTNQEGLNYIAKAYGVRTDDR